MAKFNFLVRNIRHFKGTSKARLDEVVDLISELDPDVFSLIEFKGKSAIRDFTVDRFKDYDFAVTDSTGNLELVIGYKCDVFDQVVWTQKRQFIDVGRKPRPGALISLKNGDEFYSMLFLHTDSGTTDADYKNRKKVFAKVWKLLQAPAKRAKSKRSNLMVLGDLNTMGRRKKETSGGGSRMACEGNGRDAETPIAPSTAPQRWKPVTIRLTTKETSDELR